jgi:uncharacterized membrane protein
MIIDTTIGAAGLAKSRIEALSDGVFSIAMTLLVLDVRVPAPSEVAAAGGLAPALLGLWPRLLTYALSFGLLGVYWVGHHVTFHFISGPTARCCGSTSRFCCVSRRCRSRRRWSPSTTKTRRRWPRTAVH